MMTAHATIESAIEAMKLGAFDYLQKPFEVDELLVVASRALDHQRLRTEHRYLISERAAEFNHYGLVGRSRRMEEVIRTAEVVAKSRSTVLIMGETGTGKEMVARAIHYHSAQREMPLIKVKCAAIPETLLESELFGHVRGAFTGATTSKRGKFALADGGTIFLDEIGTMSPALQSKLLRVIQEREFESLGSERTQKVDVRVIAATNRDLKRSIAEKQFREDLFYRLNVIPIELPPLRRRTEDIPLLASHFVEKHKGKAAEKKITGIAKDALQALMNYHFPGNVRELENSIEYAVAFTAGPAIQRDELPKYILEEKKLSEEARTIPLMPLKDAKHQFERSIIMAALIESGGNISEAARLLHIHRQNLQQKIHLLGIDLGSVSASK
jgi:DNA-binding NtrC family response regulator